MTIYVDDFHTLKASAVQLDNGRVARLAHMIGTDTAELHAFARKIGLGDTLYRDGIWWVPIEEQRKAVLLGAVAVPFQELAAMVALRHLGEDMEPHETAPGRRQAIVRQVLNAGL